MARDQVALLYDWRLTRTEPRALSPATMKAASSVI